jgi:hypothetical protein
LADVLLHNICERILFPHCFLFLHKKEMRSGTRLQQPYVFLPGGPQRNMAISMAGFLEKPAIFFVMFFDLEINTLSNIATKLSFSEIGATAR